MYPAHKLTESPESVNFQRFSAFSSRFARLASPKNRVNPMPARKSTTASANSAAASIEDMGFEDAMAELDNLIQAVENNRLPLEETLQSYQRGQQLIARCTALLRDAEQRIQQFDGERLNDFNPAERA